MALLVPLKVTFAESITDPIRNLGNVAFPNTERATLRSTSLMRARARAPKKSRNPKWQGFTTFPRTVSRSGVCAFVFAAHCYLVCVKLSIL